MGSTTSNASPAINSEPSESEFYHHYKDMCNSRPPDDCDTNYEQALYCFQKQISRLPK